MIDDDTIITTTDDDDDDDDDDDPDDIILRVKYICQYIYIMDWMLVFVPNPLYK